MAEALVEVAEFTEQIVVPEGGDLRNASSVRVAFQGLANRTKFTADMWSDVAAVSNFPHFFDLGAADLADEFVWNPALSEWFSAGTESGNPAVRRHLPPFAVPRTATVPAGNGMLSPVAIGCSNAGVLLLGGAPGSGTSQKLRRSTDGVTWAVQDTVSTATPRLVTYFEAAGRWIVGFASGSVIDTSTDGITFASQAVANSHARRQAAQSSTRMVIIGTASTSKVLTTDDGVTFDERDVGDTQVWRSITYSEKAGKFFLVGDSQGFLESADGITWSSAGPPGSILIGVDEIRSFGRLLIVYYPGLNGGTTLKVSPDFGTTWFEAARVLPSSGEHVAMAPNGQTIILDSASGECAASLRLGF